jgi:hypothetical protein
MGGASVDALGFGTLGLLNCCSADVSPVGHLNHVIRDAVDVAGVIEAAGAELAAGVGRRWRSRSTGTIFHRTSIS